MRRVVVLCVVAVTLLALTVAPAEGDVFGSISLLSTTSFQQFEYIHDPVVSGNGQYVAFDGSIGGVSGVWRRENKPGGALLQVAGGAAELPSISENGQYISFTTNEGGKLGKITNDQPVLPSEDEEPPNVYVRDMTVEPEDAGAFVLASAENGSQKELAYEQSPEERAEGRFGSMAAGRSAISADGQHVVFVTTAASNLAGPGTPPLEVAARDLETEETQLVSVEADPSTGAPTVNAETGEPVPVPGGAVFTRTGGPPPFVSTPFYGLSSDVGASISGDGTTVAWMGENVGEQIRTLANEPIEGLGGAPLWRRIGGGEHEPVREITGGPDPENPECEAHLEVHLQAGHSLSDPCQGPFPSGLVLSTRNSINSVPQLSSDGYTVAFLANVPLVSQGEDYGGLHEETDAYVVNMHAGLSRQQALRPLTEIASGEAERLSTNASILDLAISPDGEQVALTTMRTVFPLGSLTYVSVPAAVPGLAELFDVDLANNTLTRITHGYEGGAASHPYREEGFEDPYFTSFSSDDGALSPSFSGDGDLLAFSSTASNLVYGDGNTPSATNAVIESDGSDAFIVSRLQFPSNPTSQLISAVPSGPSLIPQWKLGVTAETLTHGRVRLYVTVPGSGTLHAVANGAVEVHLVNASRRARGSAHKGARATHAAVLTRSVASASQTVTAGPEGVTKPLVLTLGPSFRTLAARLGGLSATVVVTFVSPGHAAVHQSIDVSFRYLAAKTSARGSRKRRGAHSVVSQRRAR
jgi:hypothetical protein